MTDITETSQTVAAGQLRAFIERIERVEEEIKTLNADKSEIYKEARGVGFDVKAVRQCVAARKLDSAEREERNAIFDLYWEALTGASRVHVHEEPKSTTPKSKVAKASSAKSDGFATAPHDPETGEIIEQNSDGKASGRIDPSAGRVSPPARTHEKGSGSANTGGEDVTDADNANTFDGPSKGKTSLAAREGEKSLHSNSDANSSDLTSSPETTDKAGAEPPPSASATNSNPVAASASPALAATVEAGADPLAAPADNSEIPDHATSGAADGQPSKPNSEAARAKNDGPQKAVVGQDGPIRGHSEQAVTISDADVPAFLKKAPSPAPNPDCQKPQSCRWSHSQASCAKCANDAAVARQRGRAAA
ncbi:DUF2312 domain-containing protein [Mesorhizobium sp. B2-3-4]|nr:DUF2312 domain-containing protein [Mesorhizobium sp. B2-3-4]